MILQPFYPKVKKHIRKYINIPFSLIRLLHKATPVPLWGSHVYHLPPLEKSLPHIPEVQRGDRRHRGPQIADCDLLEDANELNWSIVQFLDGDWKGKRRGLLFINAPLRAICGETNMVFQFPSPGLFRAWRKNNFSKNPRHLLLKIIKTLFWPPSKLEVTSTPRHPEFWLIIMNLRGSS